MTDETADHREPFRFTSPRHRIRQPDLVGHVLLAVMFTRHGPNPRRFGDIEDNVLYWNFVVATWIPIYLCIYWIPRL